MVVITEQFDRAGVEMKQPNRAVVTGRDGDRSAGDAGNASDGAAMPGERRLIAHRLAAAIAVAFRIEFHVSRPVKWPRDAADGSRPDRRSASSSEPESCAASVA